jgi:hypothetical protein
MRTIHSLLTRHADFLSARVRMKAKTLTCISVGRKLKCEMSVRSVIVVDY